MTTLDLETTKNQARKLLDSSIESVADLTLARKRVEELREQLANAELEDKKAYLRATKDGWSEDELKKLGLDAGMKVRRPRRGSSGSAEVGPASSTFA